MHEVVRDFGLIDKDKKGYVTVDGIKHSVTSAGPPAPRRRRARV